MSTWRTGTLVCSRCEAILNVKCVSDNIFCYLCGNQIDLSELPVVEETVAIPESNESLVLEDKD